MNKNADEPAAGLNPGKKEKDTDTLFSELNKAKTEAEMKNFYKRNEGQLDYPDAAVYLTDLLSEHNLKKADAVRATGLERTFAYHLLSGKKAFSRDKLLIFAVAIKLSVEETQTLLKYAGEGRLYARDSRDGAIIYALNQKLSIDKTNEFLHGLGLQELV